MYDISSRFHSTVWQFKLVNECFRWEISFLPNYGPRDKPSIYHLIATNHNTPITVYAKCEYYSQCVVYSNSFDSFFVKFHFFFFFFLPFSPKCRGMAQRAIPYTAHLHLQISLYIHYTLYVHYTCIHYTLSIIDNLAKVAPHLDFTRKCTCIFEMIHLYLSLAAHYLNTKYGTYFH